MSSRFIKLISRFSSQYPASNIIQFKHHGLSPNSGYRYRSNYSRMQTYNSIQARNYSVNSGGAEPGAAGAPLPPQLPPSFLKWILGLAATIIVPSTSNTWGPFLQFKNDVDTAVETIEGIVEAVEKVAEIVDMVAEEISDDLPAGGRLKKVVDLLEDVAEAAAKDAHTVGDVIDKFQEVEEKIVGTRNNIEASTASNRNDK